MCAIFEQISLTRIEDLLLTLDPETSRELSNYVQTSIGRMVWKAWVAKGGFDNKKPLYYFRCRCKEGESDACTCFEVARQTLAALDEEAKRPYDCGHGEIGVCEQCLQSRRKDAKERGQQANSGMKIGELLADTKLVASHVLKMLEVIFENEGGCARKMKGAIDHKRRKMPGLSPLKENHFPDLSMCAIKVP
jgi:hypothetical protein